MLLNYFVQQFLFKIIGVVLGVLWLPLSALHLVAPNWEGVATYREMAGIMAKGAFYEPGCKKCNPYFLPGDAQFAAQAGACWTLGFAGINLTRELHGEIEAGRYNVAGYSHIATTGVMDDMFVRAVYLDDNTGRGGILYAVIDCVGISDTDANKVRALVWNWAQEAGIKSIQIAATHAHSCIDTIGLWADLPFDGKDAEFQQHMIEQTARALRDAYDARQNGKLFLADTDISEMLYDSRGPEVFDPMLTRLRFAPTDSGKPEVYLLCMGCHPELAGPGNAVISADFPAYAIGYIEEQKNAEAMFIQGGIGGLISVRDLEDVLEAVRQGDTGYGLSLIEDCGMDVGKYALGELGALSAEIELPALLNIASGEFELPVENIALVCSLKMGIINHGVYTKPFRGYAVTAELSYLRLGLLDDPDRSVDILVFPGELSPEIALGGFMGKEESALGKAYPRGAIFACLDEHGFASNHRILFGKANNFLGYIIPENDFVLDPLLPYFNIGSDRNGKAHYEESVSPGPQAAKVFTEGFRALFEQVAG